MDAQEQDVSHVDVRTHHAVLKVEDILRRVMPYKSPSTRNDRAERHKKCDQQKPNCANCIRNKLLCTWPKSPPPGAPSRTSNDQPVAGKPDTHAKSKAGKQDESPSPEDSTTRRTSNTRASDSPARVLFSTASEQASFMQSPRCTRSPGPLSSFPGINRAAVKTPLSPLLLRCYVQKTSRLMVAKAAEDNPYINILLPLAYFDDLLMNTVMALSGQHLLGHQGPNTSLQRAARHHYGLVLRELIPATGQLQIASAREILRLLLVTLVVCNVEAFSGDQNGALFMHLRAARRMIHELLQKSPHKLDTHHRSCTGFALEQYCFLVMVSNITPYGLIEARTIPFDTFTLSLKRLEAYDTHGIFFVCGRELFEHIPRIALLAQQRLREEAAGGSTRSGENEIVYAGLLDRIENWCLPSPNPRMIQWLAEYEAVGEIWRHAIIIYLKSTQCGSCVDDAGILRELQDHVTTVVRLCNELKSSPYTTTLMWPALITGSCMVDRDQRRGFRNALMPPDDFSMIHVEQALQLLQHLWEDNDKRSFGPYGLYLMMEKHEINQCVA